MPVVADFATAPQAASDPHSHSMRAVRVGRSHEVSPHREYAKTMLSPRITHLNDTAAQLVHDRVTQRKKFTVRSQLFRSRDVPRKSYSSRAA